MLPLNLYNVYVKQNLLKENLVYFRVLKFVLERDSYVNFITNIQKPNLTASKTLF